MNTSRALYAIIDKHQARLLADLKKLIPKNRQASIYDLRSALVNYLYPLVNQYVDWYAEQGTYLPEAFEQDPTTWTEVLRKIQRALMLDITRTADDGEIFDAVSRDDKKLISKLEGEVKEGFLFLGKHLYDLRDPLKLSEQERGNT